MRKKWSGKKNYFVAEDRKMPDGSTCIHWQVSIKLFSRYQAKKMLKRIRATNPGAYCVTGRALAAEARMRKQAS